MLEAKLVIIGGKTNRSQIKLKLPTIIGRGSDADITISHQTVSRHHCRLEDVDGALVLRDNGSTNGTFVGKRRIKETVVKPGDVFSVGPLTFRAEYDHSGSFPMIGDHTVTEGKRDTIEFAPGAVPAEAAAAPPSAKAAANDLADLNFDEPAATAPAAAEADMPELDFNEPPAAAEQGALQPAATAAPEPSPAVAEHDSGEFDMSLPGEEPSSEAPADDFMSDLFGDDVPSPPAAETPVKAAEPVAEPEPAAIEAEAAAEPEAVAEPEAIAEPEPAEVEAEAADELDLTLPAEDSSSEEPEDDFMASLFDESPSPPAALDFAEPGDEVEIDLHSSGDAADEVDFDLQSGADEVADSEPEGDTTEMFVSAPVEAVAPSGKTAPESDVLDLGPIAESPSKDNGSPADDDAAEAVAELDFFSDDATPTPAPAQAAAEPADDDFAEEAPSSRKAGKEKPAKKGWFGLGKGKDKEKESKRSASKEKAEQAPAAAKQPASEPDLPPAVQPTTAGDEPEFDFLGSPTPSSSPAKEEDDDVDNFFQDLGLN